ncbi:MAG TPA: hypothetical protein VFS21_27580 [Roseiflexaceae bacterium]|nr:hypothetical protein [Roseiflexaceae bacterium]
MTTTETTTVPTAPTATGVLIKHDPARHNSFLRTVEHGDLFILPAALPADLPPLQPGMTLGCTVGINTRGVLALDLQILAAPAPDWQPPPKPRHIEAVIARITADLGETDAKAQKTLERLVRYLGQSRAEALLAETAAVEDAGGMLLADGSRRRTRGGVFFFLARQQIPPEARPALFGWPLPQKPKKAPAAPAPPPAPAAVSSDPPSPAVLAELLADLDSWERATASTARIILVGRPGPVQEHSPAPGQPAALVAFETVGALPAPFPRGVPDAPGTPTRYLVLVAGKQWRSVAGDLAADAGNRLLVEGVPAIDPRLPDQITVRVTKVEIVGPRKEKG